MRSADSRFWYLEISPSPALRAKLAPPMCVSFVGAARLVDISGWCPCHVGARWVPLLLRGMSQHRTFLLGGGGGCERPDLSYPSPERRPISVARRLGSRCLWLVGPVASQPASNDRLRPQLLVRRASELRSELRAQHCAIWSYDIGRFNTRELAAISSASSGSSRLRGQSSADSAGIVAADCRIAICSTLVDLIRTPAQWHTASPIVDWSDNVEGVAHRTRLPRPVSY